MKFTTNHKLLPITKVHKKEESYTGDKYEFRVEKWIMKSRVYNEAFKGPWTVYSYLWNNIIRAPMVRDKYNVYETYYCNGQLACSVSIDTVAAKCNLSRGSAWRYLNSLINSGVIQKMTIKIGGPNRTHKNIYILGFISPHTNKEIPLLESLARQEQSSPHTG